MVGAAGFEPATSRSQSERANRTTLCPDVFCFYSFTNILNYPFEVKEFLLYDNNMEKTYSQIIGSPVVVEGLGKVARITDILIDHNNGKVCCFFVDQGKMKIITPMDILFFGQTITIHEREDIIDAEDVIKVQDILENDVRIHKSRVETKKGEYLGIVQDYYINTKAFGLTKIIVFKSFLGLFKSQDRIISARDIVEIKKGLIIVKNKCAKAYEEEEERVRKLSPDMA